MKLAFAGDLHSNKFAVEGFLRDLSGFDCDLLVVTGDLFGYYPWAAETYRLISGITTRKILLRGNHDAMLARKLEDRSLRSAAAYWPAIEQNLEQLRHAAPESLEWLAAGAARCRFQTSFFDYDICHGTPDDPLEGRFYPDDGMHHDWIPDRGHVVVMGHTHYPIVRRNSADGLILNPGSVGQPRDGNPDPSWILFCEETGDPVLRRFKYDIDAATRELLALDWDPRAIKALRKDRPGRLEAP